MTTPYLTIDLAKIEHNARTVVELCRDRGIAVTGVTKLTCGHPEVARAMLRGGVTGLADSRLENIRRMRDAGIQSTFMLLRLPPLSDVESVAAAVDLSLNSEVSVLQALSDAARRQGRRHQVILMVDLGDLREGVWPDRLLPLLRQVKPLPGIRIVGLGANLACFAGVIPTRAMMRRLVALAEEVELQLECKLQWLSAINSSGLELIASGQMPERINHARIGEAILLGRETIHRRPWPETCQDAFCLHAEVLELQRKPSVPMGARSEDAFGHRPRFEARGEILRALLNIGREDVELEGLEPLDRRLRPLGASSGYLVLDATAAADEIRVGDDLAFSLNYGALLRAMTSEYVNKQTLPGTN
ncbi:MAG: alanine/ornithine racemase family PLP-dependent enzyme [Chromatiales bacterium]